MKKMLCQADSAIKYVDKFIRVITIAPVMALILILSIYFFSPHLGMRIQDLICTIIFIVIMPVLAYPLQPILPKFRKLGRLGQRNLAIIMAVIGYIFGILYSILFAAPKAVLVLCLTYLISGVGIALCSKYTSFKASGHACGIAGPITAGTYYIGSWALTGVFIFALAFVSSLRMKRHNTSEFIAGAVISFTAFFVSLLLISLF